MNNLDYLHKLSSQLDAKRFPYPHHQPQEGEREGDSQVWNKKKLNLVRPTPEEEEIAAQLAEDPDTYEWTDEDWANVSDHPGTLP